MNWNKDKTTYEVHFFDKSDTDLQVSFECYDRHSYSAALNKAREVAQQEGIYKVYLIEVTRRIESVDVPKNCGIGESLCR